ncbi:MAG: PDZ domain-containing protein [Treponema sp.]|jgi:C-terminal peptidase prc|nr:PDZ domain-containing protein [Treponema sp.]
MKTARIIVFLGVFLLLFAACQMDAENDTPSPPLPPEYDIYDELVYTHALLDGFFLYAKERLNPVNTYLGLGGDAPYGDIRAMYGSLEEPFTRYFTPEQKPSIVAALSPTQSAYVGFEYIQLSTDDSLPGLFVTNVWPDSPAEEAGLMKLDRILIVNGVKIEGDDLVPIYQEASKGGEGTAVVLTVLRGDQTIKLPPMVKKILVQPTVYLNFYSDIPVIQITQFMSTSEGEFQNALVKIKDKGDVRIGILDLRGNPGGGVDTTIAIADELIADGEIIRYEDHYIGSINGLLYKFVDTVTETAEPGGLGEDIRWICLTDENSASATEILLCALKNSRSDTYIIGENSYGKGIGQYYLSTLLDGITGITALKFYNKDGISYDGIGIAPDEECDPYAALERAIEFAVKYVSSLPASRNYLRAAVSRAEVQAMNEAFLERRVTADEAGGAWKFLDLR